MRTPRTTVARAGDHAVEPPADHLLIEQAVVAGLDSSDPLQRLVDTLADRGGWGEDTGIARRPLDRDVVVAVIVRTCTRSRSHRGVAAGAAGGVTRRRGVAGRTLALPSIRADTTYGAGLITSSP
jgi:hypothetical protein